MKKRWIFLALISSMVIASSWSNPEVSGFFHNIMDPILKPILDWNIFWGMSLIVIFLTVVMSLVQKYATDQETLKAIKKEQKKLQEEMKKYKDHPEKMMQLNKDQMEIMGRMMKISMGSIVYTAIPFMLFIRWFGDYFSVVDYKFFGVLTWFWFYLLASIVLSGFIRKLLKVA